ncbi:hypothetical protein B9Z55_008093 [Caenorhabditis nigoni]|uniref:HMG box domain-containing protein n=1 Tax=Caenorhabditis nigoni TaxID=1611254 RepID=A0A2G5VCM6_9PELO|nr:hypothetical protein B9Z55_008093 [Caenorhabditis nigoni]
MLSISPPAAPGATFPKRTINTMSGFSIWVELNEQKFRESNRSCTESQIMQKMKYFWRAKMLTEEKQEFNRLCEQRKREMESEKMRINEERLREKNPNYVSREIQQRPRIPAPRDQREEFVQKLDEQWNQLPEDTKKPFMEKYQEIRNAQNENQQGDQRMSPPAYFPPNSRPRPLQENHQNFQQQIQNQNSRQANFQEPEMDYQQIQNSRQMNYEESRISEIQNSQNIPQGIPVRIVKIKRVVLKNHHGQRFQNHGNGNLRFVSKNPQNNGPRLVRILEKVPGHWNVPESSENPRFQTNSRIQNSRVWKYGAARKTQISHNPVKMEIVDSEYSDSQQYENYPDDSNNYSQDQNCEFQESQISNQLSNDQNYQEYDYQDSQEHLNAPNSEYDVFSPPEDQFVSQNGSKLYRIVKNEHPVAPEYQNRQFQSSRAHFDGSRRPNQDFADNYDAPEYSTPGFEDIQEVEAHQDVPVASGSSEYAQNGHLQYPLPNSNAPITMSNAQNYEEYGNQGSELFQDVRDAPDVRRRRVNEKFQIPNAPKINYNYQYSDSEASTSSEYTSNSENSKFSPISKSCQYSNSIAQPEAPESFWKGTNLKNASEDAPGFSEEFKSEFDAYQEFQMDSELQNSNFQAPETEFLAPDAPQSSEMDSELENSNLAQENEFLAPDAPKPYSRKYENWPVIDPNERIFFDLPDGPIWM